MVKGKRARAPASALGEAAGPALGRTGEGFSTDGRHARAERTREAIADALISLIQEGEVRPSAERVAERAGVSRRALFHHFTDLADLHSCVATRRMQTLVKLWPRFSQEGTTEERLASLVNAMSRFHEQVAPMRRVAIYFAMESKVIANNLAESMKLHRGAVEFVLAAELLKASAEERESLLAGLSAITGFSFWEELRRGQGLAEDEAKKVVMRLSESLLSAQTTRRT